MSSGSFPTPQQIHLGTWTNWSRGPVFGVTLTMTQRNGLLFTAFIALFVTFVGTCFWRISSFILHHIYTRKTAQDGIYHQRQAALRNSAASMTALWTLGLIMWRWRHNKIQRPFNRIFPVLVLAILNIIGFTIAGIFSSRIAGLTGQEVLLSSKYCGILNLAGGTNDPSIADGFSYMSEKVNSYMGYVQNCYIDAGDSAGSDCGLFVQQRLNSDVSTVSRNASCPFDTNICRSNDSNIILDTGYLNSHLDLGFNAPELERVLLRRIMHCAPLGMENFTENVNFTDSGTTIPYTRYNYGPLFLNGSFYSNFTYEQSQYSRNRLTSSSQSASYVFNGSQAIQYSDFVPLPALRRNDADVYLVFLAAKNILYSGQVDDYWYAAHKAYGAVRDNRGRISKEMYIADNAASTLGCAIQYQTCNTALPKENQCSPLLGGLDMNSRLPGENDKQYNTRNWILGATTIVDLVTALESLGATSLASRTTLVDGVQSSLPSNQWQFDVERWTNITLAAWQGSVVDTAIGPANQNLIAEGWWMTPSSNNSDFFGGAEAITIGQSLCRNQKVKSTAYSNFSVFGLSFTFMVGGFIIILNYTLEPIVSWVQKRHRSGFGDYAKLEWYSNGVFQLQRLAHEELGFGSDWVNCDGDMPRTKTDIRLAVLSIDDPKHPKLAPQIFASASNVEAGSEYWQHKPENTLEGDPYNVSPNDDQDLGLSQDQVEVRESSLEETQQVVLHEHHVGDTKRVKDYERVRNHQIPPDQGRSGDHELT
ncbi:hypothetical protein AOQ84DRAFT_334819 [Glonium stellatum]|uniref:Uncharacterized protein n=1 Tax=Glonium stellatum TaxID=574774 RepID=A0A8E2F7Q1_9PEZI|nr:hypothetical protein AOQ84DRAFT_334819 [Glonium stellatum]